MAIIGMGRVGIRSIAAPSNYTTRTTAFAAATGITDTTILNALNTFDTGLISNGLDTKMKAVYPFVGGTATTHKYNFMDARDLDIAFRINWYGGVTHNLNGITGNNVNGYGDTMLNVLTDISDKNYVHCSLYQRNNINENKSTIGSTSSNGGFGLGIFTRYNGEFYGSAYTPSVLAVMTNLDSRGFYLATRTGLNNAKQYKVLQGNTTSAVNTTTTTSTSSSNFVVLGNGNYFAFRYSLANLSFTSIGSGMNDSETSVLATLTQAMQTSLSRQV